MKRATRVLGDRVQPANTKLALRVLGGRREMARLPRQGRFNLGGDPSNDLALDDPYASSFHAYLECDDGRMVLHDLKSTNGSFVNGARAIAVEVERGARLRIGRSNIVVVDSSVDERGGGTMAAAEDVSGGAAWRMIGRSRGLARTIDLVVRAAPSRAHVLIQGESGTGKELVARMLHESSPRARQPFVVVNCGAIPRELVESEFFGHERGAFTGATERRAGVFELADKGTLFLDEIGELPLAQQPRLLRVLETRRVRPVGSSDGEREVDVRVVAATHRDLAAEVEAGRFRLDLYHRLSMLSMVVPPLRDRPDDLEPLARHFLAAEEADVGPRQFAPDVFLAMRSYHWPGNVRELRNAIMRAATLSDSVITSAELMAGVSALPERPRRGFGRDDAAPVLVDPEGADSDQADRVERQRSFDEHCRDLYMQTLLDAGSIRDAAARLGMPKSTLADRMRRLGCQRRKR